MAVLFVCPITKGGNVLTATLLATAALIVGGPAPDEPLPYWQLQGCSHGHTRKLAKRGVRSIYLSPKRLTKARVRHAKHFSKCTLTVRSNYVVETYRKKLARYRKSYRGYWLIAVKRQPGVHNRLALVRFCESTNRYHLDTHHDGAYQYDTNTWREAQSWYGSPYRYRTGYAYQASANHQDAVTGRFFPSHRSRWNASRHCWG